jgi:uncharacterized membrane protein YdjX (TVP38/TMEM64 family)
MITKIVFLLLLILPTFILQFASQTKEVQAFILFIHAYFPIYLISLFIGKTISIVYPPLPGAVFTLAAVPLIGWKVAYTIDILGSFLGASISFYLGKKYGYTILSRVVGKTITNKISSIKLKPRNQVEAATFLRFAAGGLLSDGLAWGASLIGFRYFPFMTGHLISHVATTLPVFYFFAASISLHSWAILGVSTILAWLAIYKFKGRYFE